MIEVRHPAIGDQMDALGGEPRFRPGDLPEGGQEKAVTGDFLYIRNAGRIGDFIAAGVQEPIRIGRIDDRGRILEDGHAFSFEEAHGHERLLELGRRPAEGPVMEEAQEDEPDRQDGRE